MKSDVNGDLNIAALLVLLGRTDFTDEQRIRIAALSADVVKWELFADLAIRHGIAALVWQNMADMGIDNIPTPEVQKRLETALLKTIARVTYIISETNNIVSLLEEEGIRVLLLKGTALEALLYGARGLRQMSDIDLLVCMEDIFRAVQLLKENGYRSKPPKSPLYRWILPDISNHLPDMQKDGASVDIHHSLFGKEAKELTQKAVNAPLQIIAYGREHFILPPQTAYLSMVKHLNKHLIKGEFQLRLFIDIYLLLEKFSEDIFTSDLMEKARSAGIENEVKENLLIMMEIYGVRQAEMYCQDINVKDETAIEFLNYILNPGSVPSLSREMLYREKLLSLPGCRSRIIFLLGDMFPSILFMKERYGCKTTAGCLLRYPHRLGKIVWFVMALIRTEDHQVKI